MKKIFLVILLLVSLITSGCSKITGDSIKMPNTLVLKPELVELFDDKDAQVAIVDYVKELVSAYNSRNNGIPTVSSKGEEDYKIFTDYIQRQNDGIFKYTVSSKERDLRMQRIKKSIELQEIGALIAHLKLDEVSTTTIETTKDGAEINEIHGKLDDTKALEIKTKTENLLKSYFK